MAVGGMNPGKVISWKTTLSISRRNSGKKSLVVYLVYGRQK